MSLVRTARERAGAAVAALALLAGAAACGGSAETVDEGPFTYDAARPLEVTDRGILGEDYPIAVHDISYASLTARVDAFLAVPPGNGRLPAVVYVHGAGGDRSSMLGPALWMAARGAVTLAISAPSGSARQSLGDDPISRLEWQRRLEIGDVVAARRAVDVLEQRPDVDADRIAFVGWSAGARAGAILAGVEPRLRALVLISGGVAPVSAFVAAAPVELRQDVERILSSTDAPSLHRPRETGVAPPAERTPRRDRPARCARAARRGRPRRHRGALVRRGASARTDCVPRAHEMARRTAPDRGLARLGGEDRPVVDDAHARRSRAAATR